MKRLAPFSCSPLICTDSIDEAEVQLSGSLTDLEILSVEDRKRFNLNMNGVNFRRTSVVFNHFGSDTKIRSRTPGDSLLFIVGGGSPSTFVLDGEAVTVTPQKAAVMSPHQRVKVIRPEGSEVLVVKVSAAVLNSFFSQITDQYFKKTIVFPSEIDLSKGSGVKLKEALKVIISELNNKMLLGESFPFHDMFDHMLLTTLLELPHSQSKKILAGKSRCIAPAIVKIAEEYIEAHLTEPITITDLLSICMCSRTTLYDTFQVARSYSPMEFLIERRLQRARRLFMKGKNFKPVASIAFESGFTHLGRFSQVYKKRFGESPSETIHNNR